MALEVEASLTTEVIIAQKAKDCNIKEGHDCRTRERVKACTFIERIAECRMDSSH